MNDTVRALVRSVFARFGRPDRADEVSPERERGLAAHDTKLSDLEREQREIAARIQLIERQSDPRGVFRNHHDG